MYDYGPPRVKLTQHLGGTPSVIGEMDINAPEDQPAIYEVRAHFKTEKAGLGFSYAYDIPAVLENFWMQGKDGFARPELLIDWIELEGRSMPVGRRPATSGSSLTRPTKTRMKWPMPREVLTRFMTRAYRRPVPAGRSGRKLALFEKLRAGKPWFVEAIKVPLAAVLASPHFLYLVEPEPGPAAPRTLTTYELASRLSYFLWSSMPDAELMRLAQSGELTQPDILRGQVNRLLADARSECLREELCRPVARPAQGRRQSSVPDALSGIRPSPRTLHRARNRGLLRRNPAPRPRRPEPDQKRLRHHQ